MSTDASKISLHKIIVICLTIFGLALIFSQTQLEEKECIQAELFGSTIGKCRGAEDISIPESFATSLDFYSENQLNQIKNEYTDQIESEEEDSPNKVMIELLLNKIDIKLSEKELGILSDQITNLEMMIELLEEGKPLPDNGGPIHSQPPEQTFQNLIGTWEFSGTATTSRLSVGGEIRFYETGNYEMRSSAGDETFSLTGKFDFDKENQILTLHQKDKKIKYYVQSLDERNQFKGINPMNFEEYTFSKNL